MSEVARLLADVDAFGRSAGPQLARALFGVVNLLAAGAPHLDPTQILLFEAVLERLLGPADLRARAEAARRLAPLEQAPHVTLLTLAHDEIVVARFVLTASPLLDDQDLVAVAVARGRDHMLAISERPSVSEIVTDVLVARGDAVVHHAIVANPLARFSALSTSSLVRFARADEALLELLGERGDLPEAHTRELMLVARDAARARLSRALPPKQAEIEPESPQAKLIAAVTAIGDGEGLDEEGLADLARRGQSVELVAALALLSGLPVERAQTLLDERDDDLLVVIAQARGWSLETVRAIMTSRAEPADSHALWLAEQSFANLSPSTAARILHFVRLRDGPMRGGDQRRRNVR